MLILKDDAHVMEIFKSKFTDFKSFNTQLYNCAKGRNTIYNKMVP